jgi:alcohol dehydrogenase class IV
MTRLARYIGLGDPSFSAVMQWVLELRDDFDIPRTIQAAGIDDKRFDKLAAMACVDPTASTNPVKLTEEDCHHLFERSYAGS